MTLDDIAVGEVTAPPCFPPGAAAPDAPVDGGFAEEGEDLAGVGVPPVLWLFSLFPWPL